MLNQWSGLNSQEKRCCGDIGKQNLSLMSKVKSCSAGQEDGCSSVNSTVGVCIHRCLICIVCTFRAVPRPADVSRK